MAITAWMNWEAGVDLCALTGVGAAQPNVMILVARMVHTPVGSAPAGMVFFQPDPAKPPEVMGFVSADKTVGAYFGPNIFKGTPFEAAPALEAKIEISLNLPASASAKVTVGRHVFESTLSELKPAELIHRPAGPFPPFAQQGLEAAAGKASLKVNGKDVPLVIPPVGISGGPAAVFAATGIYAR